jgi:alanine-glyoxylate transaminase/serine-glyoxylate transaminase/serine-pyruvate transaminase
MTIGPTRVAPSVLARLAEPPPLLTDECFLAAFAACLDGVRRLLGARGGRTFVVPGTGTMGLEMAAVSMLAPETPVLVVSTGYWGDRWAEICRRAGLELVVVRPAPGAAPDPASVAAALAERAYGALLLTHVDSSTGVRLDVATLARSAAAHGALVLVDGMCAAGAEVVEQTAWGVDAYVTGTPKALGVPAGLVLLSLSDRATAQLEQRSWAPASFSLDLRPWLEAMEAVEAGAFAYWQSPAGNLVLALEEGLRLVFAEGLDARVERHRRCRLRLHDGLDELGLGVVVREEPARANGVSVCLYPEGLDASWLAVVRRCGVVLPAGWHAEIGKVTFRIGHLGNVTDDDVERTLAALARALELARPRALVGARDAPV